MVSIAIDASTPTAGGDLTIALEVTDGEVVAVTGANGAGKSTLLRLLAGRVAASRGEIRLAGRLVDAPAARCFVPSSERRVGMVFQDPLLLPHLSALDNVAFGLRCAGLRRGDARARAAALLADFGVEHLGGRRARVLSGGEAQRVALARALAPEPDVLLLDEPLSSLDRDARDEVRATLRRAFAEFSGAVLVVTHDDTDVDALASRRITLAGGSVVDDAPVGAAASGAAVPGGSAPTSEGP